MNQRASNPVTLVLGAALAAIVLLGGGSGDQPALAATSQGAGQEAGPGGNPFFSSKVAGLWFSGDLPGYQQFQNIHSDGTMIWSNNIEYGYGSGEYLHGAVYGTWQQTGRRELRSVEMGFIYDGDGRHTFTGRVSSVYTFAPDFESFSGFFVEELFTPEQDPTDPEEVPVESFGGPFTGRRVPLSTWSSPIPDEGVPAADLPQRAHRSPFDLSP